MHQIIIDLSPKHTEWNRNRNQRCPSDAVVATEIVSDIAIAGTWQFGGLICWRCEDEVPEFPQWGNGRGQSRWCLPPSEKENEPHIKSVQFLSSYESLFAPSIVPKSHVPLLHLHPFFSPARWSLLSIFTRYYLCKQFGFAGWEKHTVFFPDRMSP